MKRMLIGLMVLTAIVMSIPAIAEEFNVEQYSYEELLVIREQVNQRIAEMDRQYAIEHGDRKISFESNEVMLYVGKSHNVKPTVTRVIETAPQTTSFVFTSSDASIAKVNSEGKITGVSAGEAVITVTAKDNDCIFNSFAVKVVPPVKTVTAVEKDVTLYFAGKENPQGKLQFTVAPEDAHFDSVTWKSSDSKIVTVDENGVITGLQSGKATITATIQCAGISGDKKVTYNVHVVQPVTSITLSESNLIMNKGASMTLKASILPDTATNKKVEWSSSDPKIATVSNGRITAKACGTCVITCTATDGSNVQASCTLTVKQLVTKVSFDFSKYAFAAPSTVSFNSSKCTLALNESYRILPTISPNDASEKTLNWTSSNTSVAKVSKNGEVTALKGGDCVITCTTTDGSNKSASYNLHVPAFSFKANKFSVYNKTGLDISLELSGITGYNLTVTESSSCFDVKVSGNKLHITPLKAGNGKVTIKYKNDSVTLTIIVSSSAVYDNNSYPKASYNDILRYPSSYKGDNVQIYGKVLQKTSSGSRTVLRVGTSGYGYYDSVFWVEYTSSLGVSVIEDDYITVYGQCTGAQTYESIWGQSITIPSINAEKINIGRK